MTPYEKAIDEVTNAADMLAGDGYTPESRVAALQTALQIWLACQCQKHEETIREEQRKHNLAQQQFFNSQKPPS